MGIVIFSGLSEGSSYVFTTTDLGETYIKKEGTNISIGLYPTFEELVGVKSYLELEEINNMVSSNTSLYNEILDPIAYTSKFTLLTHKNELIETHVADLKTNFSHTIFYPDEWIEWKSPNKKFAKKVGNTVPDLINAYHTNTPEGKVVILSKYDDSIHILDHFGETLYRYKLDSGEALHIIALAANDDFIFFLKWKGTLSEATIDYDPGETWFFNDFYEIDQRHLFNGEKVVFEWLSSGIKSNVNINTSVFIPMDCSLENSESFLNLDIELESSLSNNFVLLQNNMDCLNCLSVGITLEEINNAVLCGDNLVAFSDNFISLGIDLQVEAVREYVKLDAVLKCYQFVAGYFEIDHSTEVIFRKAIHISEGSSSKTRAFVSSSSTGNNWGNELAEYTYSSIPKIRPNLKNMNPPNNGFIAEKDYTAVYNIRMSANRDGLFIIGSDNYLATLDYSSDPDSLPKYESWDPDALRLRSFVCKYDFITKWPTKLSSQLNRVNWLGSFVNDNSLSMIFPSRTTVGANRNYIKTIWFSFDNENFYYKKENTVSYAPSGYGAHAEQTQWHQNIGQKDGFSKQCYLNSSVIGYLPYHSSDYTYFPIDKPKCFTSGFNHGFSASKYSKFTPSFLSFHLEHFPKFIETTMSLVGEEIIGLKLNCNAISNNFSIFDGVKVSADFFQDHCIKLDLPLLEDSHGGLKVSANLANKGYREKTVMVSNSSLIAHDFLPSREYINYLQSVSKEERLYHYEHLRGDSDFLDKLYLLTPFNGQYPQSLYYWTKNEYIPSKPIFDLFPYENPIEYADYVVDHALFLSIEFFAKDIKFIQDAVLLDYGLYTDKIGENLAIGYVKDNEWFLRTSDGLSVQYISLGSLPINDWDFYYILVYHDFSEHFTEIKIYKNGSLFVSVPACLIRFGNEKVYIGQNSRNGIKLQGLIDQFKIKKYKSGDIGWTFGSVPAYLYDPSDPSFDFLNNGHFCLNGENGIVDEADNYKLLNHNVKVSNDSYYGSTSVHFDSNSFIEVQIKDAKGIGWRVSPDIVGYKNYFELKNRKDKPFLGSETSMSWQYAGDHLRVVIPPVPVHFETDSEAGFLFGIYNKFDDDFALNYYYEQIGGFFPFYIYNNELDPPYDYIDNENLLTRPIGVIEDNDNPPITENYWNTFYDEEEKKLGITRQFEIKDNYLPVSRLYRTSSPNTNYDLEINLPLRVVEETTYNTYWFNYRKLGIDKTKKRLIIIRVKGGLDYRGFSNFYFSDLSEEGRSKSAYELFVPEDTYPSWDPSWDLTNYDTIKFDYLLSEHVYEVNTYAQRDFLIYNYELGFVDHISVINGLQDDDVVCHLYEKNGIYYILTQVKEPEPASPEDFFNTVLQNQTGYESDTHFYKYTRYVYKKTRVYTLEGNLKTDSAVLFYEFNYSTSSLDSIMIQEVTDKHIWLNWDGVSRFEPVPFVGFALNLDGSGHTEVPFLQTVYFNNETQKWEIIVREITDDNRLPNAEFGGSGGTAFGHHSSETKLAPIKIRDRFPKTGNPVINPVGDKYVFRDQIERLVEAHSGFTDTELIDSLYKYYFCVITDKVLSYDEENFNFLREESVFQETAEYNLNINSIWYWSEYDDAITGYSYDGQRKFAMYPAVSRVLTIKLYDWVKTNVFLVKTMSPVSQPNTWITYTNGGLFNFPFTVTDFIKSSPFLDDNRTIKTDVILG